jgi:hypothetical protein
VHADRGHQCRQERTQRKEQEVCGTQLSTHNLTCQFDMLL